MSSLDLVMLIFAAILLAIIFGPLVLLLWLDSVGPWKHKGHQPAGTEGPDK